MVVDIRWDDYAQESSEEQVQLHEIFLKTPPPLSPDRKSLYPNYNLLKTHQRLFMDDQILCWRTDLRSNVEHLAVLKLLITKLTKANRVITKLTKANRVNQVITKLTIPNQKPKPISATSSTAENHGKTA